jgi:hypothetical protein
MAGVEVAELKTNSTPWEWSAVCRQPAKVAPSKARARMRVSFLPPSGEGCDDRGVETKVEATEGIFRFVGACMAITISLVVDVVEPRRSRNSEQSVYRVTPRLLFLAPCSVEEARTGCRSLPIKYSSIGDWILALAATYVQSIFIARRKRDRTNGLHLGTHRARLHFIVCLVQAALRFSQTNKMLTSAGDTPEIREACPSVAGRILLSFCRASTRRLGTEA